MNKRKRGARGEAVGDREAGPASGCFAGRSRMADTRHDVAVSRAACEAHARIEAAGWRVDRCGPARGLRRKEG